eukprot:SM000103S09473  [mRNA]  locus=s103:109310:109889:+ [translate_table: standard]
MKLQLLGPQGSKLGQAGVNGGEQGPRSRKEIAALAELHGAQVTPSLALSLFADLLLKRIPVDILGNFTAKVDLWAVYPSCKIRMACLIGLNPATLAVLNKTCHWSYGL